MSIMRMRKPFLLRVLSWLFPLLCLTPAGYGQIESENEYLELGVDRDYQKWERYKTVEQINTFIPPLYQPAFVGHGYVLPPGAVRVGLKTSFFTVNSDDFFKNGAEDFVHENHEVDRVRTDFNLFYGLDRNFTLFLNIPYWISRSKGSVHPAGVKPMDLHVEGNSYKVGDLSFFLKKKWFDQANFLFDFATVQGVIFPTGSSSEKFDQPMVMGMPDGSNAVAFGGGPFTRFTDDGRLPASLQPGTGDFGFVFGAMGTRQFLHFRSAFHAGALFRFLGEADGVDPGNETRFFASFVKPVYRESVSIDLTVNGMHKENDSYEGTFMHVFPTPEGGLGGFVTTPRPSFRGGTVAFFSPSIIWSPQAQFRFVATASFRLKDPDLGPWPGTVFQLGMTYTF